MEERGALVHDAEGFPLLYVHPCTETHDSLEFFAPKAIRLLLFCGKRGIILLGSILNKLGLCFLHPPVDIKHSVYKARHGELYTAQSQDES